jgi:hypothetical protein
MKKPITITIDREAIRRRLPSALMKSALYRSGAGTHADQGGRYGKRERARHKAEERRARRGEYD